MIQEYLDQKNPKETNKLLVSLRTYAEEHKVPIITKDGIHFLHQLIELRQVKSVLEIGTAIGYSAIAMAMNHDIHITTIERDMNMVEQAKNNVLQAGLQDKIDILYMDALDVNQKDLPVFDLIFIDAAKAQSIKFFEKFEENLSDRGVIVTDNLLFHGLIVEQVQDRNLRQLLQKIDRFNTYVVSREDYNTYIYSIGDGMSVSIKRSD